MYCFTLHSWHVFIMYLDVQGEICCLMLFNVYIYSIFVLLWPDDRPCWGRNWSQLNKHIHKSVYILITNLINWLFFIHEVLFFSTCFEPLVLIFRRIQLYTCSIWYCQSLQEFVVACRYTAWVRLTVGSVLRHPPTTFPLQCLKTPTNNLPPTVS